MISAALQPSSRILGRTAARSAVRGAPGSVVGVPSAGLASAAKPKKKNKKGQSKKAEELTYAQQKVLAKERRRQTYEAKLNRGSSLKARRENSKERGAHASTFRSWFDQYKTRNETMDRKARQSGLPWQVRVAAVVERLPVILPDKEQWEVDYEELDAYLKQFGRDYPKELGYKAGPNVEAGESWVTNYEEILEELKEMGYTPAPRETEADASGEIKTMDRRLKERVYLSVKEKGPNGAWAPFPSTFVGEDETILAAAKRATSEAVGGKLELYCPSNCPLAVDMYAYKEPKKYFGIKTFFLKMQFDDGDVDTKQMKAEDYGWLARDEVVDRIKEQRGDVQSKLYHYLL